MTKQKGHEGKSNFPIPLKIGILITIGYLLMVIFYSLYFLGGWCKFSALTFNEFGDFLAGVFSPLAFTWLVIAVFVQKDELQAQLEELSNSSQIIQEQTDQIKQSYKIQSNALTQKQLISRIQHVAHLALNIIEGIDLELGDIRVKMENDDFNEALELMNNIIEKFIKSQGGYGEPWNELPVSLNENKDIISFWVDEANKLLEIILDANKANDDPELSKTVFASKLEKLSLGLSILEIHLKTT